MVFGSAWFGLVGAFSSPISTDTFCLLVFGIGMAIGAGLYWLAQWLQKRPA